MRAIARFELSRPFRPWLLTLVANRCRKQAFYSRLQTRPYTDDIAEVAGHTPSWAQPGTEYDAELHEAVQQLDKDQRRLLALRFYADLKLEEISEVMEMPLGTVKSRLHRVLVELRMHLQAGTLANERKE